MTRWPSCHDGVMVVNMEIDKVAGMVANMVADMMADMEVDKVQWLAEFQLMYIH